MKHEASTTSEAEPARLWAVLSDVDRWQEWIELYEEVRRPQAGPLRLGDTVYLKQRGLAGGEWTVTELSEGQAFAWESRRPGVRIVGRHRVTPQPAGGSRLTLQLEISGALSGLVALALGKRSRTYVDLECRRLTDVAAQPTAA
jgi:Polyketide cyclase / dehydrase and lipid transport